MIQWHIETTQWAPLWKLRKSLGCSVLKYLRQESFKNVKQIFLFTKFDRHTVSSCLSCELGPCGIITWFSSDKISVFSAQNIHIRIQLTFLNLWLSISEKMPFVSYTLFQKLAGTLYTMHYIMRDLNFHSELDTYTAKLWITSKWTQCFTINIYIFKCKSSGISGHGNSCLVKMSVHFTLFWLNGLNSVWDLLSSCYFE